MQGVAVATALVSLKEVRPAFVRPLVQVLLNRLEKIRASHPENRLLRRRGVARQFFAPWHPGAQAVYEEAGLIRAAQP